VAPTGKAIRIVVSSTVPSTTNPHFALSLGSDLKAEWDLAAVLLRRAGHTPR
jgi:hypothetical protein